jgi:opacity protein-like surface antigen
MRLKRTQGILFLVRILFLVLGFAVFGPAPAPAQTDLAFSVLASFSQSSSGNGTTQSPSTHLGGLFQLRHIANPLIGYEATYSYNRANQVYASSATSATALPPQPVSANAHQITGDWVVSARLLNLRPFALAGIGVLIDVPSSDESFTQTAHNVVYVYGAGLDIGLIPHIGMRLQYRGNVNKAPDITTVFSSTDKFVHSAQPMAGMYLRF